MQPQSPHWADQTAARVIAQRGDRARYVVASGITPSGTVHIGNFREVITVDFVARALRRLGKEVRFIYSWDDFDTFRKVPVNLPNQEMLKTHLRRPISRVPDAYGVEKSYAASNEKKFERDLPAMGIFPDFLYQNERYGAGMYAESIRHALERRETIRRILDSFRKEPLPPEWLPTSIYCEQCDRDEMDYERYDGDWSYSYRCSSCHHEATTDIRTTKNLKLFWRADWPMRWHHEKVDFEPGGKDHSSDGGSYDTAKLIVKQVWEHDPPIYLQYDFVSIKGGPGKMSSSSGNLYDLRQVLEIYTPEMVRWIFARQKPNTDFALAFDEDVIKSHDEFDRLEEQAYQPGDAGNAKWLMNRRVYELSLPSGVVADVKPFRPGFRVLCNRLQIVGGDAERALERYYRADVKTPADRDAFLERATRAWTWLEKYAPDEFRYQLHDAPVTLELSPEQSRGLAALRELVTGTDLDAIDPKDLNQAIYDRVIHGAGVDGKAFFSAVYQRLIGRDQGPRLPGFLKEIGKEKLLELL
jgi:lysyl-tRNA synthetase class 1